MRGANPGRRFSSNRLVRGVRALETRVGARAPRGARVLRGGRDKFKGSEHLKPGSVRELRGARECVVAASINRGNDNHKDYTDRPWCTLPFDWLPEAASAKSAKSQFGLLMSAR